MADIIEFFADPGRELVQSFDLARDGVRRRR
jgi:hypothetical protein